MLHSLDVSARQGDGPLQLLGDAVPRGNPWSAMLEIGVDQLIMEQLINGKENGKLWHMILGCIYQFNSKWEIMANDVGIYLSIQFMAISSGRHMIKCRVLILA